MAACHTVRKAVFPAAGLGTRFLPATKAQPKEMLPLVDKPIIQYGVEEAVASGVDNIILVTGRGKNAIEDHFDVNIELETFLEARGKIEQLEEVRKISNMINVAYVRQGEPLGLGHAVLVTADLVGNEPFAVILADDVIDADPPALKQMMDVYRESGRPGPGGGAGARRPGLHLRDRGHRLRRRSRRGIHLVRDLVEKPPQDEAPSNLAIIGRYILTPDIFPALRATVSDRTGEIQLTNGLKQAASAAENLSRAKSRARATTPATSSAISRPWSILRCGVPDLCEAFRAVPALGKHRTPHHVPK